ncbi:hypothetical protein L1887_58723 [Cichorium endivia]|nr:hypothetical protein L1887_58723 [Cichorium endivia]
MTLGRRVGVTDRGSSCGVRPSLPHARCIGSPLCLSHASGSSSNQFDFRYQQKRKWPTKRRQQKYQRPSHRIGIGSSGDHDRGQSVPDASGRCCTPIVGAGTDDFTRAMRRPCRQVSTSHTTRTGSGWRRGPDTGSGRRVVRDERKLEQQSRHTPAIQGALQHLGRCRTASKPGVNRDWHRKEARRRTRRQPDRRARQLLPAAGALCTQPKGERCEASAVHRSPRSRPRRFGSPAQASTAASSEDFFAAKAEACTALTQPGRKCARRLRHCRRRKNARGKLPAERREREGRSRRGEFDKSHFASAQVDSTLAAAPTRPPAQARCAKATTHGSLLRGGGPESFPAFKPTLFRPSAPPRSRLAGELERPELKCLPPRCLCVALSKTRNARCRLLSSFRAFTHSSRPPPPDSPCKGPAQPKAPTCLDPTKARVRLRIAVNVFTKRSEKSAVCGVGRGAERTRTVRQACVLAKQMGMHAQVATRQRGELARPRPVP